MSREPIDLLSEGEALRADYVRMHAELLIAVRKLRAACEAALYDVNATDVHVQLAAALDETKEYA